MLILHEVHDVLPGREREFEAAYRDGWMPALGEGGKARLLWYFEHAQASSRARNVVTYTAVQDAGVLGRLNDSVESGALRDWMRKADALRRNVTGRILVPTPWSELKVLDLSTVSADPKQSHERTLYCEDTVWPYVLDDYIDMAGEHWYAGTRSGATKVRARITMPAFLTPAEGTGVRPELYLVQKLIDPPEVFVRNLIAADYPPEMKEPDHYFVRGLKVRDQWESKILRTAAWSPLD